MIQPLRTVHRRMFIVLAAVLPVILGAGLKARPHVPHAEPETLTTSQISNRLNQATDTQFYSEPTNPRTVQIILKPLRGSDEPDLLLYWTSKAGADSPELTRAHLLGSFRVGRSYSLPTGTEHVSLVLYSLAHREIVDTAKVEVLP